MIIKDVKITLLRMPYREQPALSAGYDKDREILVVEIETASGVVGLGVPALSARGFPDDEGVPRGDDDPANPGQGCLVHRSDLA